MNGRTSRNDGESAVIAVIAVALAAALERAVTEVLGRVIDWARARTKRD
jgi:hypothetical protein